MNLREMILAADPRLHVADIVAPATLVGLPRAVSASFTSMSIVWMSNRSWGQSFTLGDPSVSLGHRRGDHIAQYPHVHGLSEHDATEYLRRSLEGTLLHELGHAILTYAVYADPRVMSAVTQVYTSIGPMTTYVGMDVNTMAVADQAHEAFAEAFRWMCMRDPALTAAWPQWVQLCSVVCDATASARLRR